MRIASLMAGSRRNRRAGNRGADHAGRPGEQDPRRHHEDLFLRSEDARRCAVPVVAGSCPAVAERLAPARRRESRRGGGLPDRPRPPLQGSRLGGESHLRFPQAVLPDHLEVGARSGRRGAEGVDEQTRRKARFYVEQILNALSPTNFAFTNPEVLRLILASNGRNLVRRPRTARTRPQGRQRHACASPRPMPAPSTWAGTWPRRRGRSSSRTR